MIKCKCGAEAEWDDLCQMCWEDYCNNEWWKEMDRLWMIPEQSEAER